MPHSSSDDQRKYRSTDELDEDIKRDPLSTFLRICVKEGIAKEEEFNNLHNEVKKQIDNEAEWAEIQPDPNPEESMKNVFGQFDDAEKE